MIEPYEVRVWGSFAGSLTSRSLRIPTKAALLKG